MKANELERLEIQLLLEAIFFRYGYDFKNYAFASIRRRILHFMQTQKIDTISTLIPSILHDETFFEAMVKEFSVSVTEMFRDPELFLALRNNVVPYLRSYPFIKIWHAGCATGEEAYSLAIIMEEEGLGKRTTFFATDFNDAILAKAKEGIFDLERAKKYISNYQQAGGKKSFSDYCSAKYDGMVMDRKLKDRITFANHNLASDEVFSETHLIFCRNVLIYFNRDLQNRVLRLFYESLVHGGILCLGKKESLLFTDFNDCFQTVDSHNRIFQKKG